MQSSGGMRREIAKPYSVIITRSVVITREGG